MKKLDKEVMAKLLKYRTVTNITDALNESIRSYNNYMNQLMKPKFIAEVEDVNEWYDYKIDMDAHFQKTILESLSEAENFYIELIKTQP